MSEDSVQIGVQQYVKISTNEEGDAMVEVLSGNVKDTVAIYSATVGFLRDNGYSIARAKNKINVTTENSKFLPQVTVSGRHAEKVISDFTYELDKANAKVIEEATKK